MIRVNQVPFPAPSSSYLYHFHGIWCTACCSFGLRGRRDCLSRNVHVLLWIMERFSKFGQSTAMVCCQTISFMWYFQDQGQNRTCLQTIIWRELYCVRCTFIHRSWLHQFWDWSILHHFPEFHSRRHVQICSGDGQSLLTAQLQYALRQTNFFDVRCCYVRYDAVLCRCFSLPSRTRRSHLHFCSQNLRNSSGESHSCAGTFLNRLAQHCYFIEWWIGETGRGLKWERFPFGGMTNCYGGDGRLWRPSSARFLA
jgi:hypothetical protein